MSLIRRILAKKGAYDLKKVSQKTAFNVVNIHSSLVKDYKMYLEFDRLFEDKKAIIKKVQELWNSGKVSGLEQAFKDIKNVNEKLKKILDQIIKEELFFVKNPQPIIQHLINPKLDEKVRFEIKALVSQDVQNHIHKVIEHLLFLNKLLLEENNYLKIYPLGKLASNIANHGQFYYMLNAELHTEYGLRTEMYGIIESINRIEKNFSIDHVHFIPVMDPHSKDLEDFYKMYEELFPDPDEREELQFFKNALAHNFQSSRVLYKTSVLLAKYGSEIIGASVFDVVGTPEFIDENKKKKICFGIGWFIMVKHNYRTKGIGKALMRIRLDVMNRNAIGMGYPGMDCLLIETNNPLMMDSEMVLQDYHQSMDPIGRLKMFRNMGFKKLDLKYIQPALGEGQKEIDYLHLLFMPLSETWKKKKNLTMLEAAVLIEFFLTDALQLDRLSSKSTKKSKRAFGTYKKIEKSIGKRVKLLYNYVPTKDEVFKKHDLYGKI